MLYIAELLSLPVVQKETDKWYLLQEICPSGPPLPLDTDVPYRGLCLYAHTSLKSEDHGIISC